MRIVKSDCKDSPSTSQLECSIDTVDGRNLAITTWDVENLVNNQLVIAGFLPLIVCFTAYFEIFGAPYWRSFQGRQGHLSFEHRADRWECDQGPGAWKFLGILIDFRIFTKNSVDSADENPTP